MKLNPESIGRKIQKARVSAMRKNKAISSVTFCDELLRVHKFLEAGKFTHHETGYIVMTIANEIRERRDSFNGKYIDTPVIRNEIEQLEAELPIYLYAAYMYLHT